MLLAVIVITNIAGALGVCVGEWLRESASETRWIPHYGMVALHFEYQLLEAIGAMLLYRFFGKDGVDSLFERRRSRRSFESMCGDGSSDRDWVRIVFRNSLLIMIICSIGCGAMMWLCAYTGGTDPVFLERIQLAGAYGFRWLASGLEIALCLGLFFFWIILREEDNHPLGTVPHDPCGLDSEAKRMNRRWTQTAFGNCLQLFIVFSLGHVIVWLANWRCVERTGTIDMDATVIGNVAEWTGRGKEIAGLAVISLWWMMLGRVEKRALCESGPALKNQVS